MTIPEIGGQIATQDNLCTSDILFAVEEEDRVCNIDDSRVDPDGVVWYYVDDCEAVEEEEAAKLEENYQELGDIPDSFDRSPYILRWRFVTACFTYQGAKEFIELNAHNLGRTRIFGHSGCRNPEWITVREHLLEQKGETE